MHHSPNIKGINIATIEFTPVENYNPLHSRPYTSSLGPDILSKFVEVTEGGRNTSIGAIGNVANDMFRPSNQSAGEISLAYGFQQRRFAFTAEIEVYTMMRAAPSLFLVTGYTDHTEDISVATGNINQAMELAINSITEIGVTQYQGPNGFQDQHVIRNVCQVIPTNPAAPVLNSPRANPGFDGMYTEPVPRVITPGAIFAKAAEPGNNGVVDRRDTLGSGARLIARKDSDPTEFAFSLFDSYRKAVEGFNNETGQGPADQGISLHMGDNHDIFTNATELLNAPITSNNLIMREFKHMNMNFEQNGRIRWSQLLAMSPSFAADTVRRCQVYKKSANDTGTMYSNIGESAQLGGRNKETEIATRLFTALPHVVCALGFRQFQFSAHNRTQNGQWQLLPAPNACITRLRGKIEGFIQNILMRIERSILAPVVPTHTLAVSVDVFCSVIHDLRIRVQVEANAAMDFIFPMFCDSTVTPCLTFDDGSGLQQISSNMSFLFDGMTNGFQEYTQQPIPYQNPGMMQDWNQPVVPNQMQNQQPGFGNPQPQQPDQQNPGQVIAPQNNLFL